MNHWNHIYTQFDPVAFDLFGLQVHWYGIMYVLALVVGVMVAKWIVKKDALPISQELLDNYIVWVEIGVIVGARLGYILFYDPHALWYLSHPWEIFNPFKNGEFVGIRGMSYHGAILGFIIASTIFCRRHRVNQWFMLDIAAIAVPAGYLFGRIGNFLNQELVGRVTDVPWGIYVDGILRHPSQLYEAFAEGIVVFVVLFLYRKRKRFNGELISLYAILYGLARFIAEFFRAPDPQLGYICCGWMTRGQEFSLMMLWVGVAAWIYLSFKYRRTRNS